MINIEKSNIPNFFSKASVDFSFLETPNIFAESESLDIQLLTNSLLLFMIISIFIIIIAIEIIKIDLNIITYCLVVFYSVLYSVLNSAY